MHLCMIDEDFCSKEKHSLYLCPLLRKKDLNKAPCLHTESQQSTLLSSHRKIKRKCYLQCCIHYKKKNLKGTQKYQDQALMHPLRLIRFACRKCICHKTQ